MTLQESRTTSMLVSWQEPKCKNTANLTHYEVTIEPTWNGTGAKHLRIEPSCLLRTSSSSVSLLLNDSTCNDTRLSADLQSCSPYNIAIEPFYVLDSANNASSTSLETFTNATDDDTKVVNLKVERSSSTWFILAWTRPKCRLPIQQWTLVLDDEQPVELPGDCPKQDQLSGYLLNVSDVIMCVDKQTIPGFTIVPCTNYTMDVSATLSKVGHAQSSTVQVSATSEREYTVTAKTDFISFMC